MIAVLNSSGRHNSDIPNRQVRGSWSAQLFDFTGRGLYKDDFDFWVKQLRQTWFGDADLDGEFNSSDLVAVFAANEYEDGIENNSGWDEGDWNADQEFDSSDLVAAFQDGGYEKGPRPEMNAVPEPASLAILMAGLIGVASVSRSRGNAPLIVWTRR